MQKLFIANRGEIAVRIIRSAKELGYTTVLAVSEADVESKAAKLADETVVIGPAPAGSSYLNAGSVLNAALSSGAEALHPGFGFLAENADFARQVQASGITWVGPGPDTIELMGNKSQARQAAKNAGVPTLAGTDGALEADADFAAIADNIGYPLVVKASAGGGGRGIRLVEKAEQLATTIELAQAEAQAAFGDPAVYLERFILHARHVEVQVLGDGQNFIHLGDRDCSMQRRHQKVLEEAPAPELPDDVRKTIRTSSVELAKRAGYQGAGTVEFLYDPQRKEAAFIEMNTRIQVEHPVTEMVTGVDIVKEQLRIAAGEGLSVKQEDVTISGHSFEARINAENPAQNFMPSPGTLSEVTWPSGAGVRVDTGFEAGDTIPPFYDSMIAKIIVHGDDREQAIAKLQAAIAELNIEGVKTTKPLIAVLADSAQLAAVSHYTTFIEDHPEILEGLS